MLSHRKGLGDRGSGLGGVAQAVDFYPLRELSV